MQGLDSGAARPLSAPSARASVLARRLRPPIGIGSECHLEDPRRQRRHVALPYGIAWRSSSSRKRSDRVGDVSAVKWHPQRVPFGRSAPTRDSAAQPRTHAAWQARFMNYLPSLYKARGVPVKSPICAICLDRTRGKTLERQLTHGVRIWLCEGHHSVAFMRRNAGRDFVVTLTRSWRVQRVSHRAHATARSTLTSPPSARPEARARAPRPGSYAWPRLRREAEAAFARGDRVLATIARLRVAARARPRDRSRASARCGGGSATVAGSACLCRSMRRSER